MSLLCPVVARGRSGDYGQCTRHDHVLITTSRRYNECDHCYTPHLFIIFPRNICANNIFAYHTVSFYKANIMNYVILIVNTCSLTICEQNLQSIKRSWSEVINVQSRRPLRMLRPSEDSSSVLPAELQLSLWLLRDGDRRSHTFEGGEPSSAE